MRVVTFGEIMLKLQPERKLRFMQENKFEASFGGSEANVAVCLSNFGVSSEFVTKLPNNDIALASVKELKGFNVKTDNIKFGEGRMGLYYIEKGASFRGSKVIYDRKYSTISEATTVDFNWDEILKDANWFHFSGITPALSKNVTEILIAALKVCKAKKITVSCDFNFRNNLWSKEECEAAMNQILPYVNVCIGIGEFEANEILHISGSDFEEISKNLISKYGFDLVVSNFRDCRAYEDNTIWAKMYDGKEVYTSKKHDIHVVDRVGGGDSFTAGLIYGILNNLGNQKSLEIAIASSAIKHTIEGDFNRATIDEVTSLVNGNSCGRVKR